MIDLKVYITILIGPENVFKTYYKGLFKIKIFEICY